MFKKLLILLMAAFLLTGCFDMSNRFPEPIDETPVEDTGDENVTDEDVVDEDVANDNEEGVDETDTEEATDEEVSDDEITDEENADEAADDETDEKDSEIADEEEPADEDTSNDESTDKVSDANDVFVQAFLNKYPDWEEKLDTLELTVSSNDGSFASGSVRFTDEIGGAGWFAANTDGGWVIAWDGNGTIGCAEIEPYDFPLDLIPECWDDGKQVMVNRSEEDQTEEEGATE